jgi:O-antigen ligase
MSLLKSGTVYFHSHSGYLEMALGIGVLGAVVHVLTLLLGARGLAARHRTNRDPGSAFGAALIGALLLSMVTEPTNMSAYLMPTFVVMAFLAQLAFVRDPAEVAQRRVPPLPEVRSL